MDPKQAKNTLITLMSCTKSLVTQWKAGGVTFARTSGQCDLQLVATLAGSGFRVWGCGSYALHWALRTKTERHPGWLPQLCTYLVAQ